MFNYTVSGLAAKEARMEAEANGREIPPLSPKTEAYKSQCHYRLAGVVVHSGTAFAGHYYSYIKVLYLSLEQKFGDYSRGEIVGNLPDRYWVELIYASKKISRRTHSLKY